MSTLITKYRPKKLSDFIGNDHIVKSLQSIFESREKFPHVFLFTGKSGCGKSTLSNIIATELHIHSHNIHFYDTSNERGIDVMREIVDIAQSTSIFGGDKLIILEEANAIPKTSQNALLTILENPPEDTYFVLCTTEPESLEKTIRRRCHEYQVKALDRDQIHELIHRVMSKEGIKTIPKKVINKIIMSCEGSPGVALKQFDMIKDLLNGNKNINVIDETIESASSIVENDAIRHLGNMICNIRESGDTRWAKIKEFLTPAKKQSAEEELMRKTLDNMQAESIRNSLAAYIANALWKHPLPVLDDILEQFLFRYEIPGKAGLKLSIYRSTRFNHK